MTDLDRPPAAFPRRRKGRRSWEREAVVVLVALLLFVGLAIWLSLGR